MTQESGNNGGEPTAENTVSTLLAGGGTKKVIGKLGDTDGVGVYGYATGSGTTCGVKGEVDSASGYGLATPDDVRIKGRIDTDETAFRVETGTTSTPKANNVILGHESNTVKDGATGVVIGGGGEDDGTSNESHTVTDDFATISGGTENAARGFVSTVAGGRLNEASSLGTAILGGKQNETWEKFDVIGGGLKNDTSALNPDEDTDYTIGVNAVLGGEENEAEGGHAAVGGGQSNHAKAKAATVPGGYRNEAYGEYSLAAGREAHAHDDGSFVWADSTDSFVSSSATDQFLVEAGGGTGIGTTNPVTTFHVKDAVAESGGDNPGRHVAAIENTSSSTDPTPDVLGLELTNETDPTQYNSYVSFMDSMGTIGNIQGNGNGGIEVRSADTLDLKADDIGMVTVDGANNKVTVNGDIEADNKNFVQSVDTDDGEKEVVYASTEAPTPRAEASGVTELEDGRAEIELPDHFGWVTDDGEPLHVQTTPYSADSGGLAVVERSTDRLVVEDLDGEGDYEFSYTVKGAREGYTDEKVVREPTTNASGDASPTPADD